MTPNQRRAANAIGAGVGVDGWVVEKLMHDSKKSYDLSTRQLYIIRTAIRAYEAADKAGTVGDVATYIEEWFLRREQLAMLHEQRRMAREAHGVLLRRDAREEEMLRLEREKLALQRGKTERTSYAGNEPVFG